MALKTYKPVTPSLRQLVLVDRSELYKGKPVKALTEGKIGTGGRNKPARGTRRLPDGGVGKRAITRDLITYKPVTPSLRQLVLVDRSELYKGKPVKALTEGKIGTGGRNNLGRVTVRFRGGGHKQAYRYVDFKRRGHAGEVAAVERIEYDPNRTAFIALVRYPDGELSYILAPQRLAAGDTVVAGDQVDIKPGNAMPVGNMPVGTIVHNVELKVGKGGALARSAGTYEIGRASCRE